MNVPFFTPTFKITMGKLWYKMIKEAGKTIAYDLPKSIITGKELTPMQKVYAKGFLTTLMINQVFDSFFKMNGFERDEWGRRYTKEYDSGKGKRELVFVWSAPSNMFHKYAYRYLASIQPDVENSAIDFISRNRWEIHPLWRVGAEVLLNKTTTGDPVYSGFDKPIVKMLKSIRYSTKSIVRLVGLIDRDEYDKEAVEQFRKEAGQTLELITRAFAFKYTRSTKEEQLMWKMKRMNKRFKSMLYRGEITDEQAEKYYKDLDGMVEKATKSK